MSKFKTQGFSRTFKNARKGLRIVLKSERNIRIHFMAAVITLVFGMLLGLSAVKLCMLLFAISFVVVTEMVNSAIEFALDAVFHNRYSTLVGMAKDISAGAVMFATFVAIVVGILILGPAVIRYFAV